MDIELGGLHHVSAITGDAAGNLDFYTRVLGLRLVKKTVNQDDVSAYHLFYGDETGQAGTEVTFFDFPGAIPNRPGSGTISTIALAIPAGTSIDWWRERLDEYGVSHDGVVEQAGRPTLPFRDPEGQALELVVVDDPDAVALAGKPWDRSPVPAEHQIRGLHSIRITVADLGRTADVLTGVLGYREAATYQRLDPASGNAYDVVIYEVGSGGPGTEMHVEVRPDLPRGRGGAGGVHHVAFRTPDDEQHLAWQRRVSSAGLHVTDQIDRFYFRSIYFREPGGVLYEIATDGPGFATDEPLDALGETLALPPFLEPRRKQIEAGLRPIEPRAFSDAATS